jgi:hypothetical protein
VARTRALGLSVLTLLLSDAAALACLTQDEAEEQAPEKTLIEVELAPAWSGLDAGGNLSRLYNYRTIADGLHIDVAGFTLWDPAANDQVASGYWRGLDERDQSGFLEYWATQTGHYLRFSADRYDYFVDQGAGALESSRTTAWRLQGHLAGGPAQPSATFWVKQRHVDEPDITRFDTAQAYDYRTTGYDGAVSWPVPRGSVRIGLRALGFDDRTGLRPTGWSRNFSLAATQALSERLSTMLFYSDARIDQEGLGSSSVRHWRLGADWLVARGLTWRARGQLTRANRPFTLTRFSSNHDRFDTDISWRPSRSLRLRAGYALDAEEEIEKYSTVVERPARHEGWVWVSYRDPALGDIGARYRNTHVQDAPAAGLSNPLFGTETLYYGRRQQVTATWWRSFGYDTSAHANFAWTDRNNSARHFALRSASLSVGVSTQISERVAAFADFLWEEWGSNLADGDPLGQNTGQNGDFDPNAGPRPLFSSSQILTAGLNMLLSGRTWLDATLSASVGHGGERNDTVFFDLEARHEFLDGVSVGLGFRREVFSDDFVSGYDYDSNVVTFTLSGAFSSR